MPWVKALYSGFFILPNTLSFVVGSSTWKSLLLIKLSSLWANGVSNLESLNLVSSVTSSLSTATSGKASGASTGSNVLGSIPNSFLISVLKYSSNSNKS